MKRFSLFLLPVAASAALAGGSIAYRQDDASQRARIVGNVNHVPTAPPTPDAIAGLRVPDGFRVHKFAEGLVNPRIIRVGPDGVVYVTQRKAKNVVMLRDTDGDQVADLQRPVAQEERDMLHGLAIRGRKAWMAGVQKVWVSDILPDGSFTPRRVIADGLPDAGQHNNRTLALGPDGKLYLSIGSTCNACDESDPRSATILQMDRDGKHPRIYASGLRNTIGFDWHPTTRTMFGWDHGIDWLGDDEGREEINRIEPGRRYGWPYIYENGKHNPVRLPMEQGYTYEAWRKESREPELLHTAHSAGLQFEFSEGKDVHSEYRGDAFVTLRGSWNRERPAGYEVARVRFSSEGRAERIEPFLTGFLREKGGKYEVTGRPVGLATLPDGSLLVGDDTNGVIYRVAREKAATGRALRLAMLDTTKLSRDLIESDARIRVSSPAFRDFSVIPDRHTEYGAGVSPAMKIEGAPAGTRQLLLMMEDPDASIKPFVHWLALLPTSQSAVGENAGETKTLLQGANTHGTVGYYGPRPPVGDTLHRYHFQVFALDRPLPLKAGFTRTAALDAMRGHVLAKGTLVGTFVKKP